MAYGNVDNSESILDSRDIIAQIEYLSAVISDDASDADEVDIAEQELAVLRKLADEGISEWEDGATLIRDSYFTEYAEQLAGDIGAISADAGWPLSHIDWEAAADELKMDYMSVDFDGVEYWARA
jgi:hypothetical protein